MQTVHWCDGLWIGPQHFELQTDLLRREGARMERWCGQGVGLWDAIWDSEAWDRGILRWNSLVVRDVEGQILQQGSGFGMLEPAFLNLPPAIPGGVEECSVFVWATGVFRESILPWKDREVRVLNEEWGQGFAVPAGVNSIEVARWRRVGARWEPASNFLPAVLRLGASLYYARLMDELRQYLLLLHGHRSGRPEWQRQLVSALWICSDVDSWKPHELRNFLWEILAQGPHVNPQSVPASGAASESQQILELVGLLACWARGDTAVVSRACVTLLRNGPAWFGIQMQAQDWKGKPVELIWLRAQPFRGDEVAVLRCASLLTLPRLVRAALPGVPLQSLGPLTDGGGLASLRLRVDIEHSMWLEVLQSGSLALHCVAAGEGDRFELREVES